MLRLMKLLTGNVSRTIDQLAKEMGITPRTVYRYIDTIREAGFVVNKLYGNVYQMGKVSRGMTDFKKLIYFTEEEAYITARLIEGIDNNKLRPFLTLDRCTQSTPECVNCEVAEGCAWCQGENFDTAKTHTVFERATAICKMHKARVRANNYYWNKLYRKLELEGKHEEFEANKKDVKPEIC